MVYEWDAMRAKRSNLIRLILVLTAALVLAGFPTAIVLSAMAR